MNIALGASLAGNGMAEIEVAGHRLLCDPRGALVCPAERLLVVSDMHLEKGAAFARRGRMLPPYDSAATLETLAAVIATHDPRIVISLGDSFHDGKGAQHLPLPFRDRLSHLMRGRNWIWVAGNHDPEPPAGLGGDTVAELAFGALTFRHEPCSIRRQGEIAGHLHPGAVLHRRGRAVRRRCFATDGMRLVMPAFGAYTGALDIWHPAFAGLFDHERLKACMLGEGRVYPIAARMLRGR